MPSRKTVIVLSVALFLSLLANCFMAGMLAGKATGGRGKAVSTWEKQDHDLRQKLSEDDRKILKESMQAGREKFGSLRKGLNEARQRVETAMNADPFDQAALDEALRAEAALKTEFLAHTRKSRMEAMKKLSPEGQEALKKLGQRKRGDHAAP